MKGYLFRIIWINETVCRPVGMNIDGINFLIDVINLMTSIAGGVSILSRILRKFNFFFNFFINIDIYNLCTKKKRNECIISDGYRGGQPFAFIINRYI